MYGISDIKVGTTITVNGEPYVITRTEHSKQARSAAVLRVKMKNLIGGQVLENTFQQSDTIEEANLERKQANYQYHDGENYTFMDNESFEQFELSAESVGDIANYIKEGEDVDVLFFEGKAVSISAPPKVDLVVTEAPPGIKGDTAGNATKKVTVETGYEVAVPLFIKQGETIRINTDTGLYVERVNK